MTYGISNVDFETRVKVQERRLAYIGKIIISWSTVTAYDRMQENTDLGSINRESDLDRICEKQLVQNQ